MKGTISEVDMENFAPLIILSCFITFCTQAMETQEFCESQNAECLHRIEHVTNKISIARLEIHIALLKIEKLIMQEKFTHEIETLKHEINTHEKDLKQRTWISEKLESSGVHTKKFQANKQTLSDRLKRRSQQ